MTKEGDNMLSDNISNQIRLFWLRQGLIQESIAEKAKIDVSYLGNVERGEIKNKKLNTLDKIILTWGM